jgi:hypothetical protein
MPPDRFLHERGDFKALVETVADSEKINDPALVEKDYWIMHAVFGLKELGLTFELKGGTRFPKVLESSIAFPKTSIFALNPSTNCRSTQIQITRSRSTSNQGECFTNGCATRLRSQALRPSSGIGHTMTKR